MNGRISRIAVERFRRVMGITAFYNSSRVVVIVIVVVGVAVCI